MYRDTTPNDECFVIAFCGMDGVGKSTLIHGLISEALPHALLMRNASCRSIRRAVLSSVYRKDKNEKDWIVGGFAQASAVANSIDFLLYYKTQIRPLLSARRTIVCDRYALCSGAYLHAMGLQDLAYDLFYKVRAPNITLYITADIELLEKRYKERGNRTEDETIELQALYKCAFEKMIPRLDSHIVTVNNSGSINDAKITIKKAVLGAYDDWRSSLRIGVPKKKINR